MLRTGCVCRECGRARRRNRMIPISSSAVNTASDQYDLSGLNEPPPSARWRSWPLYESLSTATMVLAGLLAAGTGIGWITGQTRLALLAAAVLVIPLWRSFLPTLFELNTDGVNQWLFGRHRRIPWEAIRRYEVCSAGVLLLPCADRCPMDAYRGLYLPWGAHRDEVLAHVRYYLASPGDS